MIKIKRSKISSGTESEIESLTKSSSKSNLSDIALSRGLTEEIGNSHVRTKLGTLVEQELIDLIESELDDLGLEKLYFNPLNTSGIPTNTIHETIDENANGFYFLDEAVRDNSNLGFDPQKAIKARSLHQDTENFEDFLEESRSSMEQILEEFIIDYEVNKKSHLDHMTPEEPNFIYADNNSEIGDLICFDIDDESCRSSLELEVDGLLRSILFHNEEKDNNTYSRELSPIKRSIIPLGSGSFEPAIELYEKMPEDETLFYDVEDDLGAKKSDSDALGIPYKIIVGLENVRVKNRGDYSQRFDSDIIERPHKYGTTLKRSEPLNPLLR